MFACWKHKIPLETTWTASDLREVFGLSAPPFRKEELDSSTIVLADSVVQYLTEVSREFCINGEHREFSFDALYGNDFVLCTTLFVLVLDVTTGEVKRRSVNQTMDVIRTFFDIDAGDCSGTAFYLDAGDSSGNRVVYSDETPLFTFLLKEKRNIKREAQEKSKTSPCLACQAHLRSMVSFYSMMRQFNGMEGMSYAGANPQ